MRSTILVLVALSAIAAAHGNDATAGLPKIMGGSKFLRNLKSRNVFTETFGLEPEALEARTPTPAETSFLEARAGETCGAGVGSCAAGLCCSSAGYCGTGTQYCAAPDCQFQYGPACDANTVPAGASTSSIARTKVGSVPYGGSNTGGVQDCAVDGEMALTFDDGPYLYTKDLLDLLDRYNAKATFFITGNNLGKGEIDNCATGYPQLIQRMYKSGHQVASHTWSHQNFTALTKTQFYNQVYYNEMAFRNIIGVIPTYLRPPYSECNSVCSTYLSDLGYHATYFDLDTSDYLNDDPNLIQNSKNIFTQNIQEYGSDPSSSNFLVIGHDIHYQTVYNLTEFMLKTMAADGYGTSVTVGTCLGDAAANWYRSAGTPSVTCTYTSSSGAATPTSSKSTSSSTIKASSTTTSVKATSSLIVSTDGSCGGTTGETCTGSSFGNCCSQYGYCGSTTDYCSTGCQSSFGICGSVASSSSTSKSATTTSKTSTTTSKTSTTSSKSSTTTSKTSTSSSKTSTTTNKTSTTSSALATSTDGSCGGTITCQGSTFGNCCSQYSYCGSTTDYCGTGCQKSFGSCT